MTTLTQYFDQRRWNVSSGVRTGIGVIAAGISTGVTVYLLSLVVGSWS